MRNLTLVNLNERIDDLGRKGYKIIQNPEVFCFGIDAVLLSDFAKVNKVDAKVIDIGTGTGIIPILMHARYEKGRYIGIDIQKEMIEMAQRSVKLNKIEKDIEMIHLDIKEARSYFSPGCIDIITCNPPYMKKSCGLENEHPSKLLARHEIACSLEDIISASSYMLKFRGKICMIHRPHRLADILCLMRQYKIEPKRMRMVYPKIEKAPTMVLVEGVKGGLPELKVDQPLIIYNQDGTYTQDVKMIYGID